ncbi:MULTISPECIES: hypothetical protein [Bacillus]|uniref:hypothetical protein n=1 Tax=Bacillus TaxID=1386 RepID=UPI00032FA70D|nr:hypothetical protein [Bacillus wiedmannii]EOP10009.1 hypothetical protein ICS_03237 [Bacillus cereus BAG2O-3]EOQ12715.1 hypothetical protein KQ3_01656 [Bacillus cereus B5-2]EOQ31179.1 hypothetical protein KQ1_02340 [Bacillus cereus BAG3O-1]MDA1600717.1 hypothetical protein [Bacillus cereus]PFW60644.1 hypothetical protein COL27_31060 [Bacillus sp. AFS075960]RFB14596.1 hypothetical protein DZB88_12060 [Bacillus sp. OE]RFB42298.1 hypothetical protein DZB83_26690 [Bacillus sp. dmp10]RFB74668
MADKYKFLILIVTAFFSFFSLIKDFRNTSKSFFWGSFAILTSFILLLTHALELTPILLYSAQIALEIITIPRKLILPSVTEVASIC